MISSDQDRHQHRLERFVLAFLGRRLKQDGLPGLLESDLDTGSIHARDSLDEERSFEPDFHIVPVIIALETLRGEGLHLKILRRKVHLVERETHFDDRRALVGADAHPLQHVEQFRPLHREDVFIPFRNHRPVPGILPCNCHAREFIGPGPEEGTAPVILYGKRIIPRNDFLQDLRRPGRKDELPFLSIRSIDVLDNELVRVGRNNGGAVRTDIEEQAA